MAGKRSLESNYSFDSDYSDEYEEKSLTKKKVIIVIAIILIAVISIVFLFSKTQNDENVGDSQNTVSNTVSNQMISTHEGYDVLGKIVIEDLQVEQYILDSKEDAALDKGVIRLYGGSINNYGNFCIAGHNKSGVFEKLIELEVEDTFTIIEPDFSETTYKITEIYSVEADDLKCLLQDDDKIEITLITCENASTTRLVVKAEEVQK